MEERNLPFVRSRGGGLDLRPRPAAPTIPPAVPSTPPTPLPTVEVTAVTPPATPEFLLLSRPMTSVLRLRVVLKAWMKIERAKGVLDDGYICLVKKGACLREDRRKSLELRSSTKIPLGSLLIGVGLTGCQPGAADRRMTSPCAEETIQAHSQSRLGESQGSQRIYGRGKRKQKGDRYGVDAESCEKHM